jgi:hypothetical protein
MKSIRFLFVLVALTVVAVSQEKETVTAKGIVTSPITGDPVPGATVRLSDAGRSPREVRYEAMSGEDGRFTIEKVIPGRYRVVAEKTGFTTPNGYSESNADSQGRHMVIGSSDIPSNLVRLSLVRGAKISGRVVDEKGAPLEGLQISVLQKGYDFRGKPQWTIALGMWTEDTGKFERSGFRPGEYIIRVNTVDRKDRPVAMIPTTYYPGVIDPDRAVPVKVTEGAELSGLDIRVTPSRAYSIKLKLQSAKDLADILFDFEPQVANTTAKEDDGTYFLRNVPPGDYELSIIVARPTPIVTHRVHARVIDRDVDLGTVNVDSQVSILGRVVVPSGVKMPRNVTLDGITAGLGMFAAAPVAEDGTFRLERVSRGDYTVGAGRGTGQYVQMARYNARDVTGKLLVDDATPGALEVFVDGPTAKIEGTVQDSRGDASDFSRVLLVPEASVRVNPNLFQNVMADNFGRFSMSDIRPGKYTVVAWKTTLPNQYMNPEFYDAALPKGTAIDLKPGQTLSVQIRVAEPAEAK